jgi:hypothetical protein
MRTLDPLLPFEVAPVNGREALESGLWLKATVASSLKQDTDASVGRTCCSFCSSFCDTRTANTGRIGLTKMTANLNAFCDRGIIQAVPHSSSPPTDTRMILATTILVSSLAFIDGSVINVALPAIATGLSPGGGGLSWVVNGYLLPLSALLLIGGTAGDVFSRRLLLILGVGIFILASVTCAAAPNLPLLIAGRACKESAPPC